MTQELQYPACNFHLKKDFKKKSTTLLSSLTWDFREQKEEPKISASFAYKSQLIDFVKD